MKPLDPGQEQELAYITSQPTSWTKWSWSRRLLLAVLLAAAGGLAIGGLVAAAGGPWMRVGLGAVAAMFVMLLFPVIAPGRVARVSVRGTLPTADALKRGGRNKYWPG